MLSANVRLGPWIHVESVVQHFAPVEDGQEVGCRAIVTEEWEHKGHRFVRLDVLHTADGQPVARTDHTAIYRPRGDLGPDRGHQCWRASSAKPWRSSNSIVSPSSVVQVPDHVPKTWWTWLLRLAPWRSVTLS